jgi:hypothetical protein
MRNSEGIEKTCKHEYGILTGDGIEKTQLENAVHFLADLAIAK